MSTTSSLDPLKAAIFIAIERVFTQADEPLMPVVVAYQGNGGLSEIISIDPEIARGPKILLEYNNQVVSLEQALSQFVFDYLSQYKSGCHNGDGCEGKMEFDAKYRTISLTHSSYERVLVEADPIFI